MAVSHPFRKVESCIVCDGCRMLVVTNIVRVPPTYELIERFARDNNGSQYVKESKRYVEGYDFVAITLSDDKSVWYGSLNYAGHYAAYQKSFGKVADLASEDFLLKILHLFRFPQSHDDIAHTITKINDDELVLDTRSMILNKSLHSPLTLNSQSTEMSTLFFEELSLSRTTRLIRLCELGHLQSAKELYLEGRCHVSSNHVDSWSVLHKVAYRGHKDVILWLLDELGMNASTAVCSTDGWTPLHCACAKGWVEVAELLLHRGCSLHAVAANGIDTPITLLREHGLGAEVALRALLCEGSQWRAQAAGDLRCSSSRIRIDENDNTKPLSMFNLLPKDNKSTLGFE